MKKAFFIFAIILFALSVAYPVSAQDSTSGPTSVAPIKIEIEEETDVCPVGCTCNGSTTNCPIAPTTCDLNDKKQYKCSDGTMVDWCFCGDDGTWACIDSPEIGCSSVKTCPVGCVCYNDGLVACPMQNTPVQAQVNSNPAVSTATPVSVILDKNEAGQIIIKNNETQATSSEKIKVVENKLLIENSEGQYSEVKIMPETASEKAIEKLGNVQNVQIELKQTGTDSSTKSVYMVKGEKEVKIFGLFKIKMAVSSEVSAETGEVVKIQKPWWSFLVW